MQPQSLLGQPNTGCKTSFHYFRFISKYDRLRHALIIRSSTIWLVILNLRSALPHVTIRKCCSEHQTLFARARGSGHETTRKCPAGMPQFQSSANFLFQIFNMIGQVLLWFSKFLCCTVYLLPIISQTQMLVGWSDVLSLINTDGTILVMLL